MVKGVVKLDNKSIVHLDFEEVSLSRILYLGITMMRKQETISMVIKQLSSPTALKYHCKLTDRLLPTTTTKK